MTKRHSTFIVLLIGLLLLNGLSMLYLTKQSAATGRAIYVDDDFYVMRNGSAEYPYQKISEAISHANEGDSIYVFGGTYNETLTINKRLLLIGCIDGERSIISRNAEHKYTVEITADFVTLKNFFIDDKEHRIWSQSGALIHVTSNNVVLQDNNISSCDLWGIYLDSSDENTISGNVLNDTKGVYVFSSNNNNFSSNSFFNSSGAGVNLLSSNENILYYNHIGKCTYGIYSKDCSKSNITGNTITKNVFDGIYLKGDYNDIIQANIVKDNKLTGFSIDSYNCNITHNFFNQGQIGISLEKTGCQIYNNWFENMSSTGLSANQFSSNNIISLNHFLRNSVNAREKGDNQWDDGVKGNYWDDYNYIDRDHDGIGDKTYVIPAGGLDRFPVGIFLQPPKKPSNPSPADDSENVELKVTLWVKVIDVDSTLISEVSFYNAMDNTYLGSARNVRNGNNASWTLTLPFTTIVYAWYAIANDSLQENQSDIWFFTTNQHPLDNQEPIANPGGPYGTQLTQSIVFNGSQSSDPDGGILFYRWNFGDGSNEILGLSPEHTYTKPGTYTVTLTVVDDDGQSNTADTIATIQDINAQNNPPHAMFSAPSAVTMNQMVNFDASESSDTDGFIVGYRWDFDSNGIFETDWLTNPITTYSFSSSGSSYVTLEVKDNTGEINSYSASILVNPDQTNTPGFEIIIVFLAILVGFILIHRKRR